MGSLTNFWGALVGATRKKPKQAAGTAASATPLAADVAPSLARLLRPQAAYRWLLPQIAAITPQYIEMILRGALAGNHVQQWELFDLMLDTWPELSACAQELADGVSRLKLIFEPFAEEDEDPSPEAIERCKLASAALRRMAPDAAADENDLEGTIADLIDGWFRGVTCLEIDWQTATSPVHGTMLAPRASFWVHPVCFAFDVNGRLGLRVDAAGQILPGNLGISAQPQPAVVGAFPPHKFLVGIHKAKSGTALGGALLRPLAWWWCAANFSSDWLLNLAQVFGLPFRWVNYDPTAAQDTVDRICAMLQNMGSSGWAAFPAGTNMELKEPGKTGDNSPQGELLDRADRYARMVILGQTMSGSQDASKGGGKAFGAVESDVKAQRIEAAGRYVCRVLNTQLIPSILTLNYGDADEAPKARMLEDEEGGLEEAQRDLALAQGGMEIPVSFLRKKYNLPAPAAGEETIGGAPMDAQPGDDWEDDDEEDDGEIASKVAALLKVKDDAIFARDFEAILAGDKPGHPFRGNGTTKGIHVSMADEHWTGTRAEMAKRAGDIYKGHAPAQHPKLGEVRFSAEGRGETLHHCQTAHDYQAVKVLPKLVSKGKWTGSAPDNKGRYGVKAYHTLESGLRIGKTTYRAQVVVKESTDGTKTVHKFYLHRLKHQHGPVSPPIKTKSATGHMRDPAFRLGNLGPGGSANISPEGNEVK